MFEIIPELYILCFYVNSTALSIASNLFASLSSISSDSSFTYSLCFSTKNLNWTSNCCVSTSIVQKFFVDYIKLLSILFFLSILAWRFFLFSKGTFCWYFLPSSVSFLVLLFNISKLSAWFTSATAPTKIPFSSVSSASWSY